MQPRGQLLRPAFAARAVVRRMGMRTFAALAVAATVSATVSATAAAQEFRGAITGRVNDKSGGGLTWSLCDYHTPPLY